ncbi:serine dehydratase beta chain [Noviherbaspirillum malthae]
MACLSLSVSDVFRIDIGPSSSHTVGSCRWQAASC